MKEVCTIKKQQQNTKNQNNCMTLLVPQHTIFE